MKDGSANRTNAQLIVLMSIYCVASLWHFVHNAVYLHEYPNLPVWLSSFGVYAAWCGVAAVGAVGYLIYRRFSKVAGLGTIALYALLGFGGLDHYVVAPMSAHTTMMNATILFEVTAAATLLVFVVRSLANAKHTREAGGN